MRVPKKIIRIFGELFLAVGVLTFSYWMYAVLFCGNTEPPAISENTNTDAAVYTLQKQMRLLKKSELVSFAFDGHTSENEYGTYVIPGLKSTRTFLTRSAETGAVCTSMTPQGMAITEEYILISAYCHAKEHNSVIYMISKESHELIKEIVLPGQPHVGGLAYDQEHQVLWYSSNEKEVAQAISISMEALLMYDYDSDHAPVSLRQDCILYGIVRDSFMTFYNGALYVGCYDKKKDSVIARYPVAEDGNLVTEVSLLVGNAADMAIPDEYSTISRQVQGMAFYQDKLLLSQSYGILPSSLLFYAQSNDKLYVNERSVKTYRFPEKLEQICVEDDNLYVLFESAAYPYRASSFRIIDRVLKLSLPKMMEFEKKNME